MKHQLAYFLISKWKTMESKTKKKLLIFLGVFSALSVVAVVFATVLLFKAGGYLFDKAVIIGSSVVNQQQTTVAEAVTSAESLGRTVGVNIVGCSDKLMSLVAFEPWINVPLSKTFESIMASCFANQKSTQACAGSECKNNLIENKPSEKVI